VWRPGDTLFLNFILQDEMNKLPAGHPIHFQLTDPRGLIVDKQIAKKGSQRIYAFTSRTPGTAVTGTYTAVVRVGDIRFEKRIPIETVKPNRLNIDLQFPS